MDDRETQGMAAKAANIPIRFTPEGVPFHAEMQGTPGFDAGSFGTLSPTTAMLCGWPWS